jgi:hypothetical protein
VLDHCELRKLTSSGLPLASLSVIKTTAYPAHSFVSCEQGDPKASLGIALPYCPCNSWRQVEGIARLVASARV